MRVRGVFPFLLARDMFVGAPPTRYEQWRHTWLLIRRQRPMIPCPQQCPLPSKRMSKNTRAKLCSVYLRPWTLGTNVATDTVPHLKDLGRRAADSDCASTFDNAVAVDAESTNLRKAWKHYSAAILPHAQRHVSNFLLACIAEREEP